MGCKMNGRPGRQGASQAEVCGKSVSARRKGEFWVLRLGKIQCAPRTARKSMREGQRRAKSCGE